MPRESTDAHKSSVIPFRCDKEKFDIIEKIAIAKNINKSDVLRELIDAGLTAQGYQRDDDYMFQLVKDAVAESMKPSVERLAKINAKGSQASGATFFMVIAAVSMLLTERQKKHLQDMVIRARELGVKFLQARDGMDVDAVMKQGTAEMMDDD